jgi:signal transduction histidine kinase
MMHFPPPVPAFRGPRSANARRAPAAAAPAGTDVAPCRDARVRRADIGRLAASLAHEVDQPLAAIALHAHAALRCIDADRDRATSDRADTAADNAADTAADNVADSAADGARPSQRAQRHATRDIVSSMRALAGPLRAPRSHCRLDDALADVLAPYAADIERLGIDCRMRLGRGARIVPAHPVQLRQLLRNLVANAIDALRGVNGRTRTLRIAARLDGAGALLLTVRDNGVGLDPAQAQRMFEPLVTTKASGLGLGLAICRAIAAAHGGRIWAVPLRAHGCELRCLLPHDAALSIAAPAGEACHD